MRIKIYPENPNSTAIEKVVQILKKGGVIIYPTDTVYALGCDITQPKAVERICKIRGLKPEKANFSFVCADLSHLSDYCKSIDTPTFRVMKKTLPGPFTYILPASQQVPKLLHSKKKTVGIRVIDNSITLALVKSLGNPLLTASLKAEADFLGYLTDPEDIYEQFENQVDVVIDGGYGGIEPSTVIEAKGGTFEIIRQGKGDFSEYLDN